MCWQKTTAERREAAVGTANCFTNPRYGAGAATNPDPEVFSMAATQVFTAMNATHKLGGENYVLWGGREGYETLLNTDLRQEREQIGRFMQMVVEHKHKIGFGHLLIEAETAGTNQAPV
jgi:xylose isomerase